MSLRRKLKKTRIRETRIRAALHPTEARRTSSCSQNEDNIGDTVLTLSDKDSDSRTGGLPLTETRHHAYAVDSRANKLGYLVQLELISGHNLAVRDRRGTSDPYVKIRHNNYKNRSSTIYRNLNPVWNEAFGFKVWNLLDPIVLKVYDKDLTSDDFMGKGEITLSDHNFESPTLLEVQLFDVKNEDEDLGFLKVSLHILPITEHHSFDESSLDQKQVKKTRQSWKSVVSITLLEGRGLPGMDQSGFSDPYCKFKLGSQKYRSSVQHKTLNPDWKEHFEMKLYDGESMLYIYVMDRDYLSSDDFIGSCTLDLSKFETQTQHNLTLELHDSPGTIRLLLVISGIAAAAEEGKEVGTTFEEASGKFHIKGSLNFKRIKEIGLLRVTVIKSSGAIFPSGNCNPFCTVEVGNARLRTHTLYSNSNPEWNKTFNFQIKDIHNCMHVVIYNDMKNKDNQLGQVIIPLLRINSGEVKEYQLKNRDCTHQSVAGTVVIKSDLVYNHLRAAIRTINPREAPLLEPEPRFQRKALFANVKRLLVFLHPLTSLLQFIQYILCWKDKVLSSLAIVVYILFCYFIELWMLFVIVVFVLVGFYISVFVYKSRQVGDMHVRPRMTRSYRQDEDDDEYESESDVSELEEGLDEKESRKSIGMKLRQVKNLLLIVQIYAGFIADCCERFKNMICWSVPFLCWMIILSCAAASIVTFFIPLRYIIMLWGLNKLTKKLRKLDDDIPNQELLDILSRSPTDLELAKWKELPIVH